MSRLIKTIIMKPMIPSSSKLSAMCCRKQGYSSQETIFDLPHGILLA